MLSRAIIDSHFTSNKSPKELAEKLGISIGAAYQHHTRWKQRLAKADAHHPADKARQIRKVLRGKKGLEIYEAYAGFGFCTKVYREFGTVRAMTRRDGNDIETTHWELATGNKYDVVDLDGYGWPGRLLHMGVVSMLKPHGYLFVTVPIASSTRGGPQVLGLNKVTFGVPSPAVEHIIATVQETSLRYIRKASYLDGVRIGRVWRLAFAINRVPARQLWGTKGKWSAFQTGLVSV